jgi:CRP-like cAMP-binding protein
MKNGFLQKALAIYKIVLRLDPDNSEAMDKTKKLMMEIESSRIKITVAPAIETVEETATTQTVFEAPIQTPKGNGIEFGEKTIEEPAAGMDPILERTSYEEAQPKAEASTAQPIDSGQSAEDFSANIPPFLASLPKKELKNLLDKIKPQTFLAGEKIVEEGDSGDSMFVITSGNAKVVAHILGSEMELAALSTGDVFGEVAFLTGRPRTASVISTEKTEVIEFNRLILEEMFEKHPNVLRKIEDFYESHVQDTICKVQTSMTKKRR